MVSRMRRIARRLLLLRDYRLAGQGRCTGHRDPYSHALLLAAVERAISAAESPQAPGRAAGIDSNVARRHRAGCRCWPVGPWGSSRSPPPQDVLIVIPAARLVEA